MSAVVMVRAGGVRYARSPFFTGSTRQVKTSPVWYPWVVDVGRALAALAGIAAWVGLLVFIAGA